MSKDIRNSPPTLEEINALPDHIRDWIYDLETRCDQQGDLRRLRMAEQKVKELTAVVDTLEEKIREARVHANSRAKHILTDALKETGLY